MCHREFFIEPSASFWSSSEDPQEENTNEENSEENELSEKEKRLAKDYQLQRALDLIKGLSIYEESLEE